jgi:hypothetical protein
MLKNRDYKRACLKCLCPNVAKLARFVKQPKHNEGQKNFAVDNYACNFSDPSAAPTKAIRDCAVGKNPGVPFARACQPP